MFLDSCLIVSLRFVFVVGNITNNLYCLLMTEERFKDWTFHLYWGTNHDSSGGSWGISSACNFVKEDTAYNELILIYVKMRTFFPV